MSIFESWGQGGRPKSHKLFLPTLDTGRYIKDHSLYSSGDVIKLTGKNRNANYMADITQTIFVEEDPNNNCRNYANQDFRNYQECDEKYMRDLLPADLVPI